ASGHADFCLARPDAVATRAARNAVLFRRRSRGTSAWQRLSMNLLSFVVQPLGCRTSDRLKPELQTAGSWSQCTKSVSWRRSWNLVVVGCESAHSFPDRQSQIANR